MTNSIPLRAVLAGAFLLAPLSACADKTQSERCEQMADYLEGRTQILERDCLTDDDCEVVFIRPDSPVAARDQPTDAELARVVFEFREQCEAIPRATGTLDAVCIDRIIETTTPENPTVIVPLSLGHSCVLRGVPIVEDTGSDISEGDVGIADATDAEVCGCTSNAQCATGEQCNECECLPQSPCGEACIAANDCGLLRTLGLGANQTVCAASCEASVEAQPVAYNQYVQCVQTSACNALENCAALLP